MDRLARGGVPELQSTFVITRDEPATIRGDRQRLNHARGAGQGRDDCALLSVEQADLPVLIAGCQQRAIPDKSDAPHRHGCHRPDLPHASSRAKEPQPPVVADRGELAAVRRKRQIARRRERQPGSHDLTVVRIPDLNRSRVAGSSQKAAIR